jgi:hypothetical protein
LLVAVRDRVSEMHCRCCGSHSDLSWIALLKSHEVLCRSCLAWDPGLPQTQATTPRQMQVHPEYADLFEALK